MKRKLTIFWALGICVALLASCLAASASAVVVTDRPLLFSFDGTDSPFGHFRIVNRLAIDNSTGDVYVAEQNNGNVETISTTFAVCRFHSDGTAAPFSDTGSSCLATDPETPFSIDPSVAVDNSGGASQGRIYVGSRRNPKSLQAFAPSGAHLWTITPPVDVNDVAVDSAGHPWIGTDFFDVNTGELIEYSNSESPPQQLDAISTEGVDAFDIGSTGNFYVRQFGDVYADQTTAGGHLFVLRAGEGFAEEDSGENVLAAYGTGGSLDSGMGIAYNHSLDRVYAGDRGTHEINVFGSPVTGTVADSTIEAPDAVGIGKATFHGSVNPDGVPTEYYFEWTSAGGAEWRDVERSPTETLPADTSPHDVSFTALNLRGSTHYRVRLVTVNTAESLHAASSAEAFTTLPQTQAPSVTIDPVASTATPPCPSGIGPETACVSGTINPLEETVSWGVEASTDPDCSTWTAIGEPQTLLAEGRNTPVPVHLVLTGLQPAHSYCVHIVATNSFGTGTSATETFQTAPVPPSEVSLAFAAPRTSTTARINAKVNPNGEPGITGGVRYSFEVSKDGLTWTQRPVLTSTVSARIPSVVADELTGLEPGTTYHYRLASVENDAGAVPVPSEEKTFTTRTLAEVAVPSPCPNEDLRQARHTTYLPECRGIELVNDPESGNQNVAAAEDQVGNPSISNDGNSVLWAVTGGAPGAPNGTGNTFLATRTAGGWESRPLAPPAAEQVGGGSLTYALTAATPDFRTFIFNAKLSTGLANPEPPNMIRLRQGGVQEPLKAYSERPNNQAYEGELELTADGSHVVFPDIDSGQLEDIGTGTPVLLSVMPDGSPSACGLNLEGESFDGGGLGQFEPAYNWIATTDASRAYFEVKPNKAGQPGICEEGEPLGLYVRDRETESTTAIDYGTRGAKPEFIRATPDGRQGYFLTSSNHQSYEALSPGEKEHAAPLDPEGSDTNSDVDLYRFDEESNRSVCVTCAANADASLVGGVLISDDFSHIYLESDRALLPGQGVKGQTNLYVLGAAGLKFIATLPPAAGTLSYSQRPLLSENGDVLLFRGEATPGMTADPIPTPCIEPDSHHSLGPCIELYRYEASTESLECLSCTPHGPTTHSFGAPAGTAQHDFRLSADGSTVAFATEQALLPADVNSDTDIYSWRNGRIGLLTDGVSDFQEQTTAPQVRGVSADGSDIFFGLVPPGGSLTGFERNGLLELYDARVDGGFEPPAPQSHCSEESCQGPLTAAPPFTPPVSSALRGAGNRRPGGTRCRRHSGKRHHRCGKHHGKKKTRRHKRKVRRGHSQGGRK